jgi:hypothetical protein
MKEVVTEEQFFLCPHEKMMDPSQFVINIKKNCTRHFLRKKYFCDNRMHGAKKIYG